MGMHRSVIVGNVRHVMTLCVVICLSFQELGGCRSCVISDSQIYRGGENFQMRDGCIHYMCSCNCDGSWECPGDEARDVCLGEVSVLVDVVVVFVVVVVVFISRSSYDSYVMLCYSLITFKMLRLVGLVVKAPASRAEGPGFESRLRRDFFGVESYQ